MVATQLQPLLQFLQLLTILGGKPVGLAPAGLQRCLHGAQITLQLGCIVAEGLQHLRLNLHSRFRRQSKLSSQISQNLPPYR